MLIDKDMKRWNEDTLIDMASIALDNWYLEPLKDGSPSHRDWLMEMKPLYLEHYFKSDLVQGTYPIAGWVDGIYQDKDSSILLVDHKTAGDFRRWKQDASSHRYQATMYCVGAVLDESIQVGNLDEIRMHYLVSRTKGGKSERARRLVVRPELDDVALLGERVRMADRVIKEELYAPNPSWILCSERFCPFYEGCQVTKELQERVGK
jgi:hypothetical protein